MGCRWRRTPLDFRNPRAAPHSAAHGNHIERQLRASRDSGPTRRPQTRRRWCMSLLIEWSRRLRRWLGRRRWIAAGAAYSRVAKNTMHRRILWLGMRRWAAAGAAYSWVATVAEFTRKMPEPRACALLSRAQARRRAHIAIGVELRRCFNLRVDHGGRRQEGPARRSPCGMRSRWFMRCR